MKIEPIAQDVLMCTCMDRNLQDGSAVTQILKADILRKISFIRGIRHKFHTSRLPAHFIQST